MIVIREALPTELETVLRMRCETMRKVCGFSEEFAFSEEFHTASGECMVKNFG